MMTYEGFNNTPENFDGFIRQLQLKIKTLVSKLERILIKSYIEHLSKLYIYIYIYIVIYRQTVSLYHNSSVWLDTQDASSVTLR